MTHAELQVELRQFMNAATAAKDREARDGWALMLALSDTLSAEELNQIMAHAVAVRLNPKTQ